MKDPQLSNNSHTDEVKKLRERIIELEHLEEDRKRTEVALRESEERFRKLSESAIEGIAITDKGKVREANRQLAEILKIDHDELIGMDAIDFVAPESRELVGLHMRSGSEEPYEHFAQRKDGSIFPVEVRARSLPFEGEMLRVTTINDITERKNAEEEVRENSQIWPWMPNWIPFSSLTRIPERQCSGIEPSERSRVTPTKRLRG
jgi:PAS domain S-box-containing protein